MLAVKEKENIKCPTSRHIKKENRSKTISKEKSKTNYTLQKSMETSNW